MPNAKVIDLSHWNVIPESLEPAASAGVLGVIHKASEGSSNTDDKYGARRFLTKEAGLLWGAYHFLRAGDMVAQARHFLEAAQPDQHTLLVADHEDDRVSIEDLRLWLETIEDLTGRRPVIYSGHVLKDQLRGGVHPVINDDNYRLWLAQYGPEAELPPGFGRYWLWQWTQTGEVDGVAPPTDLNDYQGTDQDLRDEWAGTDEPPAAPAPPPIEATTTLSPIEFQSALAAAGLYTGVIDGLSGPMTRRAVDDWFEDGDPLDLKEEA